MLIYLFTCLLTPSLGLAPPPNPRPPLRNRLLMPLFPHPQHRPRILHHAPRRRNGHHPLRRRNRRARLLAPNPHAPQRSRSPLDPTSPVPPQPGHLAPDRRHGRAIALRRAPTHARLGGAGDEAGFRAQCFGGVSAGRRERAAADVLGRVFGGAGVLGGVRGDAVGGFEWG